MSGALVLTFRAPYPRHDGSALRVYHLMRELAQDLPCHLVTFGPQEEAERQLIEAGVFRTITHLGLPEGRPSLARHFRLSDEAFWRRAHPDAFNAVTAKLQALIRELDIAVVIGTDLWLAEFVSELRGVQRVVDECDCLWLAMNRQLRRTAMPLKERLALRLHTHRIGRHESRLTSRVELVTTVSPVDRNALQRLSRKRQGSVQLVPNGVAPSLVEWETLPPELPNAIAFWGNLDFPPNRDAVWYFYRHIFVPHLRGTGITVYLIGPKPSPELLRAVQNDPELRVTGFVEELFDLVSQIPVVINPMISGSGIKNKVLEAFALRRAVVSSRLGMEGIDATAGEHFLLADEPAAFAQAIQHLLRSPEERRRLGARARDLVLQRYTWEAVGAQWRTTILDLLKNGRKPL